MGVIYLFMMLESAEDEFFLEESSSSLSITVISMITDGLTYTFEASSTPESTPEVIAECLMKDPTPEIPDFMTV